MKPENAKFISILPVSLTVNRPLMSVTESTTIQALGGHARTSRTLKIASISNIFETVIWVKSLIKLTIIHEIETIYKIACKFLF